MNYFEIPRAWEMPEFVWEQSLSEMAEDGRLGREGLAMWLGRHKEDVAVIERTVVLRGAGLTKRPDVLQISAGLLNAVTDVAIEYELVLIGQIHSHGPFASVDLSYPDRNLGIVAPGFLSVVAPHFALQPNTTPEVCGVHVHEGTRGWRRLPQLEVRQRWRMVKASAEFPLVVGEE